jgi:FtsP/CotA-like multicopper oxidase with cupredoxin domain
VGVFDKYRARLQIQGGSMAQAFFNDTANFINQTFSQSPTYVQINVDGTPMDTRVIRTEFPWIKNLLFRPNTKINIGAVVEVGSETWLVSKFEPHPLYPKAEILKCNESLRWKDSNQTFYSHPCVQQSLHREVAYTQDALMQTIKYQIRVFVQLNNDTKTIKIGQRFILGSTAYIVVGIDDVSNVYDGAGLIEIMLEATQSTAGDDMINKIADNSHLWAKNIGGSNGGGKITW